MMRRRDRIWAWVAFIANAAVLVGVVSGVVTDLPEWQIALSGIIALVALFALRHDAIQAEWAEKHPTTNEKYQP